MPGRAWSLTLLRGGWFMSLPRSFDAGRARPDAIITAAAARCVGWWCGQAIAGAIAGAAGGPRRAASGEPDQGTATRQHPRTSSHQSRPQRPLAVPAVVTRTAIAMTAVGPAVTRTARTVGAVLAAWTT